jgi:hypothetical protein
LVLTIQGRKFLQESPTFEQELYIMQQVMDAGLDQATLTLDPSGDDLEPKVKRLILQAYKAGILFKLMASLVVEEGRDWTPELAEEQARLFASVRDPEDKKQLQPALVGGLLAFFESSVSSGETFLPSLADDEIDEISVQPKTKPVLTPDAAGEVFRTGTMKPSSEKSPSSSGSPRKSSSNGKSVKASSRTNGS